jgi:hypothetical protein
MYIEAGSPEGDAGHAVDAASQSLEEMVRDIQEEAAEHERVVEQLRMDAALALEAERQAESGGLRDGGAGGARGDERRDQPRSTSPRSTCLFRQRSSWRAV